MVPITAGIKVPNIDKAMADAACAFYGNPSNSLNMIGITGTKGKSTTSSLVARLLSEQGKKVALCGNIGVPSISYADKVDDYDVFVLEVSSYQAADLEQGFDISVVLNLYPEHIDWHVLKSHIL